MKHSKLFVEQIVRETHPRPILVNSIRITDICEIKTVILLFKPDEFGSKDLKRDDA